MRAFVLVAVLSIVATACGESEPSGRTATRSPAPIFEHERSGHVPIQLVPGTWIRGSRRLELGKVNEVVLDGRRIGTYKAEMEDRLFEARVRGCRTHMRWAFRNGDLALRGGGTACPLNGRWRRG
ncbi:MAG TPA: hypothetical protein VM784_02120 [Actinomycetota bacterium]|nr:hypothetical protein [Actinomycetota bacterium]